MRRAPVSSEGNPVDEDLPWKGDMQVLEEHSGRGRKLSEVPPHKHTPSVLRDSSTSH